MANEEKIVLQLGIKGIDPAEARRIAQMSGQELAREVEAVNKKLADIHGKATKEEIKREQEKAKVLLKLIDDHEKAVKRLAKEQQVAANKQSANWRRLAEDMENITTVAGGAFFAIKGLTSSAKAVGDEIIRTTNIFTNAKGSIEGMAEASEGQISNMDLILARNKAFEMEFKPTEEQFNLMAKAADMLGDALGTDAAEGLDKLVDGMATGKPKMLSHIGVMVDTEKAYENFAKKLGLTSDQLTDQQKLIAFQEAAFEKLKSKVDSAGEGTENLADSLEKTFVAAKNAWDALIVEIGSSDGIVVSAVRQVSIVLNDLRFLMREYDRIFKKPELSNDMMRFLDSAKPFETLDEKAARQDEMMMGILGIKEQREKGKKKKGGGGGYTPNIGRFEPISMKRVASDAEELIESTQFSITGDQLKDAEDALASRKKFSDDLLEDMKKEDEENFKRLQANKEKAAKELEEIRNGPIRMLQESAMAMGAALGDALYASISDGDSMPIVKRLKAVIDAIGREATIRAIMEGAYAISAFASGNPAAGTAHGAAAAKFAAVAVASGIASRSIGNDASSPTSTPPVQRSAGSTSSEGRSSEGPAIVINVNGALPGSEAEIGKKVAEAIRAYEMKYGRKVN